MKSWYLSIGNEIMLVTTNLAFKHFPKFFNAKVHLQYKHAICEATNHNLTREWISDSRFSSNGFRRKVLTEQIWHELMGVRQGVIKAESLGHQAAVLRDILLVFSVTAGTITSGFVSPVLWGPYCMILTLRGTGGFFRVKQASKVPLPQPGMRKADLGRWSFPLNESTKKKLISKNQVGNVCSSVHYRLIFLSILKITHTHSTRGNNNKKGRTPMVCLILTGADISWSLQTGLSSQNTREHILALQIKISKIIKTRVYKPFEGKYM